MTKYDGQNQLSILLQSRDHSELLDVIDSLQSQGVSHYVPLPQINVCAGQRLPTKVLGVRSIKAWAVYSSS